MKDLRRVRTYGNGPSIEVSDVLQSVLVAELLCPSTAFWLVSPWISDIPVFDNREGSLSSLGPDWAHRPILLSEVIPVILDAETRVTVVLRGGEDNSMFRTRLQAMQATHPHYLRIIERPEVHEKGLVTDHALVAGSMNFTFSGQSRNLEHVVLDTNLERVNQLQLELSQEYPWGESA